MKKASTIVITWLISLLSAPVMAAPLAKGLSIEVPIYAVDEEGTGKALGSIRIARLENGIYFHPELEGLSTGMHGFHLHEKPDCSPATVNGERVIAGAAGGHFNPDGEGTHRGPFAEGHAGDLPSLYFNEARVANIPVLAPRLEFEDLDNKALVIHQGSDNYADDPEPLGGGGQRVACGPIMFDRMDLADVEPGVGDEDERIIAPESGTEVNGQDQQVEMYELSASGVGRLIGTIRVENRLRGTLYTPALVGMEPGLHAFHIHQEPDCGTDMNEPELGVGPEYVPGGSAGEHVDTGLTGNHAGPYGEGHVGDLPNLYANEEGVIEQPVFAPQVKMFDVSGHSLIVHAEPDNYADEEAEATDFGGRVACGVAR